ncbi:MAG: 16S rRNA (guanine(966)-N(2))-methyltransferase RsmD [Deltaproteobacteria bacterium]|nr:16S rRNA (guanine(966)-N(2))-methyltransferase RsmD [Deltaproteobacteria bacterium]
MKIRGGAARGRTLSAPKGKDIRITADRIKESLFQILPEMTGCRFLDIFAGTGNIGIEALSREAKTADFIEINRRHALVIQSNLERCGFQRLSEIIIAPADRGLQILADKLRKYEVIFADPPYNRGLADQVLELLDRHQLLPEGGILIVEHSRHESCNERGSFVLSNRRTYGDTVLSFFKCSPGGTN